jgi:peptidoglycan/xylan/chitin deacetylase (PgdA/CDA1 family)
VSDVLVLSYHAVSDSWPSPYAVSAAELDEQVEYLLDRGYRATTFTRALTEPVGERTLAITFDDAYHSVAERALPVLERLEVPATVFACTAFLGTPGPMRLDMDEWLGGPHEDELRAMSWEQLAGLAEAGWEVGSHTRSHPRLTHTDDGELTDELAGSRADLQDRLGLAPSAVAYPFGDTDRRVMRAADDAGYSVGGAVLGVSSRSGLLAWPRVRIVRGDAGWPFRLRTSPGLRRFRASKAWLPVHLVRRGLGAARIRGGARRLR